MSDAPFCETLKSAFPVRRMATAVWRSDVVRTPRVRTAVTPIATAIAVTTARMRRRSTLCRTRPTNVTISAWPTGPRPPRDVRLRRSGHSALPPPPEASRDLRPDSCDLRGCSGRPDAGKIDSMASPAGSRRDRPRSPRLGSCRGAARDAAPGRSAMRFGSLEYPRGYAGYRAVHPLGTPHSSRRGHLDRGALRCTET